MKVTNKLNLPQAFVNFDDAEHEFKPYRYSVTELLKPVREIILTRKYYDAIEEDVADRIPALFGSAVHHILEINAPNDPLLLTEEAVECEVNGFVLSGRIDLLNIRDLSIEDYKTTSVSKIMSAKFDDWKKQGLMYAYIVFQKKGIIIKHLKFYALLKDWSKIKASSNSFYPQAPVFIWEYDIQDSDYDEIERFIKVKFSDIAYYENHNLPMCSDDERWYSGTKYAVFKNANDKRATIVCDSEQEAHDYITNKLNGDGIIEIRKGEDVKCTHYCSVCKFCKGEEEC